MFSDVVEAPLESGDTEKPATLESTERKEMYFIGSVKELETNWIGFKVSLGYRVFRRLDKVQRCLFLRRKDICEKCC